MACEAGEVVAGTAVAVPSSRGERFFPRRRLHVVPKTVGRVIINHPDGLHERIANGRADEFEPAFEQVPAQRVGFPCVRRNLLERFPVVANRLTADEPPQVAVKRAEFVLHS